jgi:hypothetical protein
MPALGSGDSRDMRSRAGGRDDSETRRVVLRLRRGSLRLCSRRRRFGRWRRSRRRRRRRRGRGSHRRAGCGRRLSGSELWGRRGRHRGYRRRVGGSPRREQAQRIEVVVVVGAEPDPEMDVRLGVLGLARRARIGDRLPLGDAVAALDPQRAEVRERGPVPAAGRDGHGESIRGHGSRERDIARGRSPHRGCAAERDVDTTMLTRRILVGPDGEPAQNGSVGGPRPRPGGSASCERPYECEQQAQGPPRCPSSEHGSTVARPSCGGNAIDGLVTESRGRARSATSPSAGPRPRRPVDGTLPPRRALRPRSGRTRHRRRRRRAPRSRQGRGRA